MLIYIQLVLALVTQQTLLSHIAIFQALENFVPWYQIHTIAFFVTIFDLVVPYWLGKYIVSNTKHERFVNIVERFKLKLNLVNRTNKYLILFIFGIFNYIYVNAFLIAFLDVNPKKALVATFFGDLVWYFFLISSTLTGINILRDIQTFSIAILLTIIFAIVGEELLRRSKNS